MRPVIAALVALLWSGAAGAHAFLDRAVPPVGATVAAAPAEMVIGGKSAAVAKWSGVRCS